MTQQIKLEKSHQFAKHKRSAYHWLILKHPRSNSNCILHKGQIPLGPVPRNFLVTSLTFLRTCWRRRQLPRYKLATSYEEVSDTPDHLDMLR